MNRFFLLEVVIILYCFCIYMLFVLMEGRFLEELNFEIIVVDVKIDN